MVIVHTDARHQQNIAKMTLTLGASTMRCAWILSTRGTECYFEETKQR